MQGDHGERGRDVRPEEEEAPTRRSSEELPPGRRPIDEQPGLDETTVEAYDEPEPPMIADDGPHLGRS